MNTQVINGIKMISVESFPWKKGVDHPCELSCHDIETWLCTLKSVWKLELGCPKVASRVQFS
jgi:hypothetical protein